MNPLEQCMAEMRRLDRRARRNRNATWVLLGITIIVSIYALFR